MTIDNSLLDINNISIVQIVWDDLQNKPILTASTINSDYNNAGNIGIGVSVPISKLDINGTVNALDFSKKGMNLSNIYITSNVFSNESINFIPRTTYPITKIGNTIGLNYDTETLIMINSNLSVLNTSKWLTSNSNIYINDYNVGIGTTKPLYNLDVNGIINCSDIYINTTSVNTRLNNNFIILNNLVDNTNNNFLNIITSVNNINNLNNKKKFYFTPLLSNGSYEYTFDIRDYILTSVGNKVRCFNLYAYSSNGNFTNSSVYSGAYIFFISEYEIGSGKKVILNESGGATINYISNNQLKYSSLSASDDVYITIDQNN